MRRFLVAHVDRLPEVEHGAAADHVDVDEPGVALGAIADEAVLVAGEIDGEWNLVDRARPPRARRRGSGSATGASPCARRRETSAGRSRRRAGPRSPAGIWSKAETPSAITRVNTSSRPVELFGLVAARQIVGQRQAFQQRHDVDAAGLQHRALRQADRVQLQVVELVGDLLAAARAGSSRARDRRWCRGADRGSPAAAGWRAAARQILTSPASISARSPATAGCPRRIASRRLSLVSLSHFHRSRLWRVIANCQQACTFCRSRASGP